MPPLPDSSPLACCPVDPTESHRLIGREVAHELNNILTIIQGYSERAMMKNGDNPTLHRDLQVILDNAKRATLVVRRARPRSASEPTMIG
jgi:signal transduction histidine kinase